ncbi:hypothetical protein ACFQ7Z_04580 [Streptomyces virginiae]|uniref:hypothetical protein n=1 Tax=Streptomyces virginiae TaxID=1961 RepID=UPI0036B44F1D
MNEQDSDSLDSFRESSAFEMTIKTAASRAAVIGILHDHDLNEEDFTKRFPVLAKVVLGLPDEAATVA